MRTKTARELSEIRRRAARRSWDGRPHSRKERKSISVDRDVYDALNDGRMRADQTWTDFLRGVCCAPAKKRG